MFDNVYYRNDDDAYFVDALRAGARFGVIASSDAHATLPGSTPHFRIEDNNGGHQWSSPIWVDAR